MSRLDKHLEHIRTEVVPSRGAAQKGLDPAYILEIEARPQPPLLVRGLEQWNAGRFYEQHETLEWLWRATPDPVRDAIKGIIQSGVGAYHALNRNRRGALAKWTGALGYLAPFEHCQPYGIDIAGLLVQVHEAREALLGDEQPNWEIHRARARALRLRWEERIAEPRVTALLRRLDRAWQECSLSVEANVAGLTEEELSWTPATGGRSILAVLHHLGIGKLIAADRCFGSGSLRFEDVTPPDSLRDLLRWLIQAHEAIREPLGFLRDPQLDEPRLIAGRSLPVERILERSIEHDLYHAGEINVLRDLYRLHS